MTLSIIFHFLILGLYQLHSSQVRTWLIFSRSIITLVSDSCNPTFEYIFKLFLNQYSTCHYVRSPQFHNHPNGQPVLIIVLLTGWTISFPTYDLLSHSCFFAGSLNLSLPILYNSTQALPFSLLSYFYPLLVRLGCPVFLFSWNFSISLPQQCPLLVSKSHEIMQCVWIPCTSSQFLEDADHSLVNKWFESTGMNVLLICHMCFHRTRPTMKILALAFILALMLAMIVSIAEILKKNYSQ